MPTHLSASLSMAFCPTHNGRIVIKVVSLKEIPYIQNTLWSMTMCFQMMSLKCELKPVLNQKWPGISRGHFLYNCGRLVMFLINNKIR